MGGSEYTLFDGSTHSLASVATETGTSHRQITEWAAMRGAKHDIAVTVPYAGGAGPRPTAAVSGPPADHASDLSGFCQKSRGAGADDRPGHCAHGHTARGS